MKGSGIAIATAILLAGIVAAAATAGTAEGSESTEVVVLFYTEPGKLSAQYITEPEGVAPASTAEYLESGDRVWLAMTDGSEWTPETTFGQAGTYIYILEAPEATEAQEDRGAYIAVAGALLVTIGAIGILYYLRHRN